MVKHIVFFTLLLLNISLSAQKYYHQRRIGQDPLNGLSHQHITDIKQSHDGLIWVATLNGLNVYDGHRFAIYKHNSRDSSSIIDNHIKGLYEDSRRRMWALARSKGFSVFTPEKGRFKNYFLEDAEIKAVCEVVQDTFLLGTNKGLFQASLNKAGQFSFTPTLIKQYITCFYKDVDTIWMGTARGGLLRWYDGSYCVESFYKGTKRHNTITNIHKTNDNAFWIGTISNVVNYDLGHSLFTTPLNSKGIIPKKITCLEEDTKSVWIGSFDKGLVRIDRSDNFRASVALDLKIRSLLRDDKGQLWVGTVTGLYIIQNVLEHYSNDSPPCRLNDNMVQSIYDDIEEGYLYVGTFGGGLNIIKGKHEQIDYYKGNGTLSIRDNTIWSIYKDNGRKDIWLGTMRGGLYRLNITKNILEGFLFSDKHKTQKGISRIIPKDLNKLWLGTNRGLYVFNMLDGSFTIQNNKLDSIYIYSLDQYDEQYIWIGSAKNGLFKVDTLGNIIHHFNKMNTSLLSNTVKTTYQSNDSILWIGTNEGLHQLNIRQNKVVNTFTEKDGLSNNTIFSILEDDQGNFWLSTNKGLSLFNPQTETFRRFYYEHGLQGNEFNTNAYFKNKDGRFFLGGTEGLNAFYPSELLAQEENTPIIFRNLGINGERVFVKANGILEVPINQADTIILAPEQNKFYLEFSAPSYQTSYAKQYTYRLSPLEKEWTTTNNPNLRYTLSSNSNYTLQVRYKNSEKKLHVIVQAYWYQRLEIQVFIGILVLSVLIWLFRDWQLKNERQKQLALNRIGLLESQIKTIQAQINPHFLSNALTSIQYLVVMNESDDAELYLEKFSQLMRLFLEATRENIISLEKEIDLLTLYVELEHLRFGDKWTYQFNFEELADKLPIKIPATIVQLYVENAILNGLADKKGDGFLQISVCSISENALRFIVEDNGIGIKKSLALKGSPHQNKLRKSYGRKMIAERVCLLNEQGVFKVDIEEFDLSDLAINQTGTRIIITIQII